MRKIIVWERKPKSILNIYAHKIFICKHMAYIGELNSIHRPVYVDTHVHTLIRVMCSRGALKFFLLGWQGIVKCAEKQIFRP